MGRGDLTEWSLDRGRRRPACEDERRQRASVLVCLLTCGASIVFGESFSASPVARTLAN